MSLPRRTFLVNGSDKPPIESQRRSGPSPGSVLEASRLRGMVCAVLWVRPARGATAWNLSESSHSAMKVIQPNCRVQFAAEDVEFVLSILGRKLGDRECLIRLLGEEESRDQILDDEDLLRALLERRGCLRVSSRFYFYILVRHAFRRSGIPDRVVADYVAEVLAEFAHAEGARCQVPGQANPLHYFFEMLSALEQADDRTRFVLRAYIGNYSLFLSGVFPERLRHGAENRGRPDMKYYEALGRSQFRAASDHRLARRYDLAELFQTLSERFQATRLALNDVAERFFVLGDACVSIPGLLDPESED